MYRRMLPVGLLATSVAGAAVACIDVDRSPTMEITWPAPDSVRLGPALYGRPEIVTIGERPAILRLPLPKPGDDWQFPPTGANEYITWQRRRVIEPDPSRPGSVRLLEVAFSGRKVGKTMLALVFAPARGARLKAVLPFDVQANPQAAVRVPKTFALTGADAAKELTIDQGDIVEVSLAPPESRPGHWIAVSGSMQPIVVIAYPLSGAATQGTRMTFLPEGNADGLIRLRFQPDGAADPSPWDFEIHIRHKPIPTC